MHSLTNRLLVGGSLTLAAFVAASWPAAAEVVEYSAELSGAAEVPPTTSSATGTLAATFDTETRVLTWTVEYSGLTDDPTAAHFHGPAAPDANASPVVPIEGSLTSPIEGTATLTEAQAAEFQDAMWYFNIHTAANPDGEIRGQVVEGPLQDEMGAPAPAEPAPGAPAAPAP